MNSTNKTKIRCAEIEDIRQFTYLGSVISTSGRTGEDTSKKKRKHNKPLQSLNQSKTAKPSEHQQQSESLTQT